MYMNVFIFQGLKFPGMPSFSDGPGKIYSIDLEDPRVKAVELRMDRTFDVASFNPHGISTFTQQPGTLKVRFIDQTTNV